MSVDSSSNGIINDEFTVALEGGRPWGFTLSGGADFRSPLKIGKVRSACLFWQSALCITVDTIIHCFVNLMSLRNRAAGLVLVMLLLVHLHN